jgi:tetratricopeptide (TPR) repeat protein
MSVILQWGMRFHLSRPSILVCLLAVFAGVSAAPAPAAPVVSFAEEISSVENRLDERETRVAWASLQPLLEREGLSPARSAEAWWLAARLHRIEGQDGRAMEAAAKAMAAARQANDVTLLVQLLKDRATLGTLVGDIEVVQRDLLEMEKIGTDQDEPQLAFDARTFSFRLVGADKGLQLLAGMVRSEKANGKGRVNMSPAALAMADILLAKGNAEAADKIYSRLAETNEEGSAAYTGRAAARILLKQFESARADLVAASDVVRREPSGLPRDLAVEGIADITRQLDEISPAAPGVVADPMTEIRAAIDSGKLDDARTAAEAAIERDRNAPGPLAALAEILLRQGEYSGAAGAFSGLSLRMGESVYPKLGGTLAQALMGTEVYDVQGFAFDWLQLSLSQKVILRDALDAARQRGPLPDTVKKLAAAMAGAIQ